MFCPLGLSKTTINGVGGIPIIGQFLKNAGNDIYSSLPGYALSMRIFRDDPTRILKALQSFLSHGSSLVRNFHCIHKRVYSKFFKVQNLKKEKKQNF